MWLGIGIDSIKNALSKANGVTFALSQEVGHGESLQQQDSFTSCDEDDGDEGLMLPFDGNNHVLEAHAAAIDSHVHMASTHQQLNPIFKEIVQCWCWIPTGVQTRQVMTSSRIWLQSSGPYPHSMLLTMVISKNDLTWLAIIDEHRKMKADVQSFNKVQISSKKRCHH
jgi:hypothetical protein